jgi:hypothetical protein
MSNISEPLPRKTPGSNSPQDPAEKRHPLSSPGSRLRNFLSNLRGSRIATVGLCISLFWIFVAIFAPLVSP